MTPPLPPDDPLGRLLAGARPPEPPASLRGRVLARAAAVLAGEEATDPWRRIWESRPLRLAWAASVLLLAGANLLLPPRRETAVAVTPPSPSDPDLASAGHLPRLRAAYASVPILDTSNQGSPRHGGELEKGSRS